MPAIKVSGIIVYPIKSTAGIVQPEARVQLQGFEHDRRWAVINEHRDVITAREFPALFQVATEVSAGVLRIMVPGFEPVTVPLSETHHDLTHAQLFGKGIAGRVLGEEIDAVLSAYLGTRCSLISMDPSHPCLMNPEDVGSETVAVSYADTTPFLLVSEATLEELNGKIPGSIEMERFRPNLVVSGCDAGEEDGWDRILIGDVILEKTEACKRCVMVTFDPVSGAPHRQQEPLRTLATYRRHPRGGVRFGINMIPRILGTIRKNDVVEVL